MTQPLTEPADGVPEVITTTAGLNDAVELLARGSGPLAVDAERASGYRYGQSAYLVQIRRQGAGTHLIDPIGIDDFSELAAVMSEPEWILHAASQDLPCLAELGLHPGELFDTELAGRLLGRARVGLSTMVEEDLGLVLAKEHSAADWSKRPLPADWLRYAALDVEVLVELRDILAAELRDAGKFDWAHQEFEHVRNAPPPQPRADPWRRTSGTHSIRDRRGLAVVQELWTARDEAARSADIAPGRILPDRAIVAAAQKLPRSRSDLAELAPFTRPGARRRIRTWHEAIQRALRLPDSALPPHRAPRRADVLPQPRAWRDRNPQAAKRLDAVKPTIRALADELHLPQENLLSPDTQRRIAWEPPSPATELSVARFLGNAGARGWQVEQVTERLTEALVTGTPVGVPQPEPDAEEQVESD